jgi:glycerol-3-phosphate cytidylyltransferase
VDREVTSVVYAKIILVKTVITYGTFDLLHYGHIELLRRAKELAGEAGRLVVGVSTDDFNAVKGKRSHLPYDQRRIHVEAIRYVDEVIPEDGWEQNQQDVVDHNVDVFVMGNDWEGKFDDLKEHCEVVYLERTPTISSTMLREALATLSEVDAEIS